MLMSRVLSNGRPTLPCLKTFCSQPLALQTSKTSQLLSSHYLNENQQKRLIHISNTRKDMESAFRAIGAGVAITGVIGPGIGIGIIFGNLIIAVGRNPSMSGSMFGNAIMGAAFCEALGLLATVISILAFIM